MTRRVQLSRLLTNFLSHDSHPCPCTSSLLSNMSAAASSSKPAEPAPKAAEPLKEDESQPTLGVLEEDDEFEEFAVAGMRYYVL